MYAVIYQLYDEMNVRGVCHERESANLLADFFAKEMDAQYGKLQEGSWRDHFSVEEVPVFDIDYVLAKADCVVTPKCSRMCERGTKGCEVYHEEDAEW